jgi:hypothetical protein
MKSKKTKLFLSKKTIADLNNFDKNRIHGGVQWTRVKDDPICFSGDYYTVCALSWCMTVCGGPIC